MYNWWPGQDKYETVTKIWSSQSLEYTGYIVRLSIRLFQVSQFDVPTSVMIDASVAVVGIILQQFVQDEWCPIAYFFRKLKPAGTRYSTFDRELLAIYLAIKHFRQILEGRQFYILTNHKPLIYSLSSSSNRHFPRQIRHFNFISQFTLNIRLYPNLHRMYVTFMGVQITLPMPYCEYRKSPRFQLQLTTLSCLSFDLAWISWN